MKGGAKQTGYLMSPLENSNAHQSLRTAGLATVPSEDLGICMSMNLELSNWPEQKESAFSELCSVTSCVLEVFLKFVADVIVFPGTTALLFQKRTLKKVYQLLG